MVVVYMFVFVCACAHAHLRPEVNIEYLQPSSFLRVSVTEPEGNQFWQTR